MNDYFMLAPLGWGTEDVEQFHSYFYRFAALHSTTMIPMARHLEQWWSREQKEAVELKQVFLYKANRLPLCGYGEAVENYVKVVSLAANQPDLYRTTLLPIRNAADAVAHGALRRGRAWCPACMYWSEREGTPYYDRLFWALAPTGRCVMHQVSLVNRCPACRAQQLAYHSTAGMTKCAKCLSSLVQGPKTWSRVDRPVFGETDCRGLIEAIATGALRESVPRAFGLFCQESVSIIGPAMAYRNDVSTKGAIRTWSSKQHRPTLSTMLKRCHVAGVKLADVLTDPRGAAHIAGSLALDELMLPKCDKPRRAQDVCTEAKTSLLNAIAGLPEKPLVSFPEFAKSLGVSKGFLRYRQPALCKVYVEEFRRQVRETNKLRKRQAKTELTLGGAMLAYIGGKFRSQDDLVDHLHANFLVKKHVARLLVSDVLRTHERLRVLAESPQLTRNNRVMLKRGRDAGYL